MSVASTRTGREIHSDSSLGSLDGLKEAPSVSFLDISPAKTGGESPSAARSEGIRTVNCQLRTENSAATNPAP